MSNHLDFCKFGRTAHCFEIMKTLKELALLYPRGVVLDFGYTSDGKWCFIEPNEAWASGLYACDASKCLDVILASQTRKI